MIYLTKKALTLVKCHINRVKTSNYMIFPGRISLNRSSVKNDSPLRLSFRNIEKWGGARFIEPRRYASSQSGLSWLGNPRRPHSLRSLRSLAIATAPYPCASSCFNSNSISIHSQSEPRIFITLLLNGLKPTAS